MLANPDDDDDEPEVDEVTSSTRLIDDADRHAPSVVRRRVTGVGRSLAGRRTTSRRSTVPPCRDLSTSPSPTVKTDGQSDDQCCCCCCCTCDVSRAPPPCHCRCRATRRFYFRSGAFPSDDDDDEEADNDENESGCSCCQCDIDMQAQTTPSQTGNELFPVATSRLSSVASISSSRSVNDVCGRLPMWTTAKDACSLTAVASSSTTDRLTTGGLASFFTFLRSRGRLWSSGRSGLALNSDWRRRGDRATSTLPPCTCGVGVHFDPPLSVAQQVPPRRPSRFHLSCR